MFGSPSLSHLWLLVILSQCRVSSINAQKSGSNCHFTIWKHRELVSNGPIGDTFGKLAQLYDVPNLDDCTRRCLFYRYCYIAQFYMSRTGIGYCTLYYYNFPPLYEYEVASPVRIIDTPKDENKTIIFNLTKCDSRVSYKHPCTYDAEESMEPLESTKEHKPYRNVTSLNTENCAVQCGRDSHCKAAIFMHRVLTLDDTNIYSTCLLYKELKEFNHMKRVYKGLDKKPVALTNFECYDFKDDSCGFTIAGLVYESLNSKYREDKHNGAKTAQECATLCGHSPFCVEAEYREINTKSPICLLYRKEHIQNAKFRTRSIKDEEKLRLYKIKCRGKKKVSIEPPTKVTTTTGSPGAAETTEYEYYEG